MKKLLVLAVAALCISCSGNDGPIGKDGASGDSCSVIQNEDGSATISCDDGTSAMVGGAAGGDSCAATDNEDGTFTLDCPGSDPFTVSSGQNGTSCTTTDNGDGTLTVSCDDGTGGTLTSGSDGGSCTVTDNNDGTSTITCDDGTTATTADGSDCTVMDNNDGTSTVTCEDGTTSTVSDGTSCTIAIDSATEHAIITCDDGTSADMGCTRDWDNDGRCDGVDPNPCDPADAPLTFAPTTASETLISNVAINGGNDFAVVNTGDSVSIALTYSIASCSCTGCITQGMVGFAGTSGASCFYEGQPACTTRSGASTETLTAPSTPGMHYLAFQRTWQFSCITSAIINNTNYAGAICVLP